MAAQHAVQAPPLMRDVAECSTDQLWYRIIIPLSAQGTAGRATASEKLKYILFTELPHPHGHWHLQAPLGNSSYQHYPLSQSYLLHLDLPDLTYLHNLQDKSSATADQ